VRAPWELAKDEARRAELDTFLYGLLEAIRLIAVLTFPTMPGASLRVLSMVGGSSSEPTTGDLRFGRLASGSALGEAKALFPRIESAGKRGAKGRPKDGKGDSVEEKKATASDDRIDIADFAKVRLRIAKVIAAERIPKSRKLLKLQVDLGSEQRQVVAGMAGAYEPESLVGRLVVVVANLKPARLMGEESNGMVLAAEVDGRPVLLEPEAEVAPGTQIR